MSDDTTYLDGFRDGFALAALVLWLLVLCAFALRGAFASAPPPR